MIKTVHILSSSSFLFVLNRFLLGRLIDSFAVIWFSFVRFSSSSFSSSSFSSFYPRFFPFALRRHFLTFIKRLEHCLIPLLFSSMRFSINLIFLSFFHSILLFSPFTVAPLHKKHKQTNTHTDLLPPFCVSVARARLSLFCLRFEFSCRSVVELIGSHFLISSPNRWSSWLILERSIDYADTIALLRSVFFLLIISLSFSLSLSSFLQSFPLFWWSFLSFWPVLGHLDSSQLSWSHQSSVDRFLFRSDRFRSFFQIWLIDALSSTWLKISSSLIDYHFCDRFFPH